MAENTEAVADERDDEMQAWLRQLWRDELHADDIEDLRKVVMDLIAWLAK